MGRYLKRVISFILGVCIITPISVINESTTVVQANEEEVYESEIYYTENILEAEYDDVFRIDDGFLFYKLKDGIKDSIYTEFKYVESTGEMFDFENTDGFTDIWFNNREEKYIDKGFLAVKKDGKFALMNKYGEIYGGENRYYNAVKATGEGFYYTTDGSVDGTIWTLRKKSGEVIKEFNNLKVRAHKFKNGFEYILDNDGDITKLLKVDCNGTIEQIDIPLGTYYELEISKNGEYIYLHSIEDSKDVLMNKDFKVIAEGLHGINRLDSLEKEGYAICYFYKDISESVRRTVSIIDSNGNINIEPYKYTYIEYNVKENRALARDYYGNIKLFNLNGEIILDINKFINDDEKEIYRYYYLNSKIITVYKKGYNDLTSYIFDLDGNVIFGPIKENILGLNDRFIKITTSSTEHKIVDYDNNLITTNTNLWTHDTTKINFATDHIVGYQFAQRGYNLINDKGEVVKNYSYISGPYSGMYVVRTAGDDSFGIVSYTGKEIIPCGSIMGIGSSYGFLYKKDVIIANAGTDYYMFDHNGNGIKMDPRYRVVSIYGGTHTPSAKENSTGMIMVKSGAKYGLIQIKEYDNSKFDLNSDGNVNALDLAVIASCYSKTDNDINWNSNYDYNLDKIIDIYDIVKLSKKITN